MIKNNLNMMIRDQFNQDSNQLIKDIQSQLKTSKEKYYREQPRKWIVLIIFIILGCLIAQFLPALIYKLAHSKYNRASLDKIMKDLLGKAHLKDALTDETLVVAYDYNSQQPRFFSKYFSMEDAGIYDVPFGDATGASSAAPTFFDPKVTTNMYGMTEMQIDGGIICNNPAFYAY